MWLQNKYYAEKMREQLMNYGIPSNRICLYTAGSDNFGFINICKSKDN